MVFCPECRTENPNNANFCLECGKKINFTVSANLKENKNIIKEILIMAHAENEKVIKKFKDPKVLSEIIQNLQNGTFLTDNPNVEEITENKMYQMIINESIMNNYDFDDKTKKKIINTINEGYTNSRMPNEITKDLTLILKGNESLATSIRYTETMQASNLSEWAQRIIEGAKYFIIDYDPRGCNYCNEKYKGHIFNIEQLYMLPPIHLECSCVPMFFYDKKEAQTFADDIQQRNNEELMKYNESSAVGYIAFNIAEEKINGLNNKESDLNII